MCTQIDNLVTSFSELLLETGNVLDGLYRDKTSNLILPNNQNTLTAQLDTSIKQFNDNLDSLLIQLNDVSLWEIKLKQKKEAPQPVVQDIQGIKPENDILDDINDLLAQVPDTGDLGEFDGNLQDNINDLLNENYTSMNTDLNTEDFNGFDSNMFGDLDSMINI